MLAVVLASRAAAVNLEVLEEGVYGGGIGNLSQLHTLIVETQRLK